MNTKGVFMNLPNTITALRLVLTAVFCASASAGGQWGYTIALVSFVLGAISDWFDGYYARKLNLVTSLGKLMDPLADKVLVCCGFLYLSVEGLCPAWVTAVILFREFLVTGVRQVAVEKGVVIAADKMGKWKTTFQLTFVITMLVHLTFGSLDIDFFLVTLLQYLSDPEGWLKHLSLWPAVVLTLVSGWNYVWNARDMILDRD